MSKKPTKIDIFYLLTHYKKEKQSQKKDFLSFIHCFRISQKQSPTQ